MNQSTRDNFIYNEIGMLLVMPPEVYAWFGIKAYDPECEDVDSFSYIGLERDVSIWTSLALFGFISVLWAFFDPFITTYQYLFSAGYASHYISFGIDGLTMCLLFITSLFVPLCLFMTMHTESTKGTEYMMCLVGIELLLFMVFTVLHLFWFYVFFEAILIPFFVLIGLHGSRERKVHASYMLFFYTVCGSMLMLVGIIMIYVHTGSTHYLVLSSVEYSSNVERLLWILFFISFAVKVPIYPFHIWLPEAHVESPTEGSVILAAILLKVGGYGFLRVLLPVFPYATQYFASLVTTMCALSIIYTSVATLRQTDIKRVVAYSSISHMNIAIIGIVNYDAVSISGSILLMLGHGIVSGGLFFVVGVLYTRFRTKLIAYYSGIVHGMPLLCAFFFLLILGNLSMPSTSNFVGELLVISSVLICENTLLAASICVSIPLCAVYSLYLFNRVAYGVPSVIRQFRDVTLHECAILSTLVFWMLYIGICPKVLMSTISGFSMKVSIQHIRIQ